MLASLLVRLICVGIFLTVLWFELKDRFGGGDDDHFDDDDDDGGTPIFAWNHQN